MPCQISKRNNSACALWFAQDIQRMNSLSLPLLLHLQRQQKEYGSLEVIFGWFSKCLWKKKSRKPNICSDPKKHLNLHR